MRSAQERGGVGSSYGNTAMPSGDVTSPVWKVSGFSRFSFYIRNEAATLSPNQFNEILVSRVSSEMMVSKFPSQSLQVRIVSAIATARPRGESVNANAKVCGLVKRCSSGVVGGANADRRSVDPGYVVPVKAGERLRKETRQPDRHPRPDFAALRPKAVVAKLPMSPR